MTTHRPDDLAEEGRLVALARADQGWSKEEAARRAGISSITWKRVEDGLPVQDVKLRAVYRTLGWSPDDPNERVPETVGTPGEDLAEVRFRRPEGMGDDEWRDMQARMSGYWSALLDQAETER